MALFDDLQELQPWMRQLNISPRWLQNAIAESPTAAELTARIRATQQYRRRFQGIMRVDGTRRWTEAEHLQREQQIRNLLRQYGHNVTTGVFNTPQGLIGFHETEMSLDELRDRLEIWDYVRTGGQRIKETFFVYADLEISDDDLFEAAVDPARELELFRGYNSRRAAQAFDYRGFIRRAARVGNNRVRNALQQMQRTGTLTGQAVQRILSIDPAFAEQMIDSIFTGGGVRGEGGTLDLQSLLTAFELTAIGAAAQNAGLELPTKERLQEIRAAGVERATAIQRFQEFGRDRTQLAAAVKRARGVQFGQRQFEEAVFLGNAQQQRNLQAGIAFQQARGREEGTFRFAEEGGRIKQLGFTRF